MIWWTLQKQQHFHWWVNFLYLLDISWLDGVKSVLKSKGIYNELAIRKLIWDSRIAINVLYWQKQLLQANESSALHLQLRRKMYFIFCLMFISKCYNLYEIYVVLIVAFAVDYMNIDLYEYCQYYQVSYLLWFCNSYLFLSCWRAGVRLKQYVSRLDLQQFTVKVRWWLIITLLLTVLWQIFAGMIKCDEIIYWKVNFTHKNYKK